MALQLSNTTYDLLGHIPRIQLHEKDEMFSMWGPDPPRTAPHKALFQFTIAASLFGGIMLFAHAATPAKPVVDRQYPYDGLKEELGGLEENKVRRVLLCVFCVVRRRADEWGVL